MTVPVVRFVVRGEDQTPFVFEREYAVVYDGNCRVCTKLSRVLMKWDTNERMQVVPSQLAGVKATFPFIPDRDYKESLQLVGPENQRWQGAAAVEQLLNILPRGWLISWVFTIPLVRTFADRFYRWFARNRYKLGCGAHCDYRALNKTDR